MEDIIPVLIMVILMTEVEGLKGELQMILDWIEADPGEMDAEKRLVINLNVSFCVMLLGVDSFYIQGLEGLMWVGDKRNLSSAQ